MGCVAHLVERQHVTHGLGQVAAGRERVVTVGVLEHDGQLGRLERVQRETVAEQRQVVGQLVATLLHAHQEVADGLSDGGRVGCSRFSPVGRSAQGRAARNDPDPDGYGRFPPGKKPPTVVVDPR